MIGIAFQRRGFSADSGVVLGESSDTGFPVSLGLAFDRLDVDRLVAGRPDAVLLVVVR